MSEDRRRPQQYAARRDETLAHWVADVVHPYSPALRPVLDRAGGRRAVTKTADLARLPVTTLAELGDGRAHVLEPTVDEVSNHGPVTDRVRLAVADLFGRRAALARREVDPAHKPVVWTATTSGAGDRTTTLFVASTATDLDRLAALGRRGLSVSGVRADDRVLVLDPAGSGIAPWQFLAGARDAGVAVLHLDRPTADRLTGAAAPTVVAGSARSLARAVDKGLPPGVRLLVVHDGTLPDEAQRATLAASGLPVALWWAPPGVRAAWVRCPGGQGFHTWPTHELVEVVDDAGRAVAEGSQGRLVWSAVGWHGSVWLRLDTGEQASLVTEPCAACGRTTPRVVPVSRAPRSRRSRTGEPVRAGGGRRSVRVSAKR